MDTKKEKARSLIKELRASLEEVTGKEIFSIDINFDCGEIEFYYYEPLEDEDDYDHEDELCDDLGERDPAEAKKESRQLVKELKAKFGEVLGKEVTAFEIDFDEMQASVTYLTGVEVELK